MTGLVLTGTGAHRPAVSQPLADRLSSKLTEGNAECRQQMGRLKCPP